MIGFFKLFLLVLLILVEIITIDKIFETANISPSDNNYKKKLFLKNMVELLILIIFIFVLVYKYLEYYGVPTKDSVNVGIIMTFLVIVVFLFQNKQDINLILTEGFTNKEHFKECPPNNNNNIPFLDEKHIFSLVPSQYRDVLSEEDRYKIACKYPFYILDNLKPQCKSDDKNCNVDISKYLTIVEDEVFDDKDVSLYPAVVNYGDGNTDTKFYF